LMRLPTKFYECCFLTTNTGGGMVWQCLTQLLVAIPKNPSAQ
jgi:hypothetical protein